MKPDFLALLRTLDRHGVEHIVVGGVGLRQNRTNLLQTRLGLLDALQTIGEDLGYDDLKERSAVRRVQELEVRVLELATVIETKETAGRDMDRAMLPVLRRTLELKSRTD